MLPINSNEPTNGLDVINPRDPAGRFMVSKKYILFELYNCFGDNNLYSYFYLRPYKRTQTLITAYLPEMEYLEDLRVYNKVEMVKFLSRSKFFSEFYKTKTLEVNKPFLSRIQDFTNDDRWIKCVHIIIDTELTPGLIDPDNDSEYKKLITGTNSIIKVVNEYLEIMNEHVQDLSIVHWVRGINKLHLLTVLNIYKEKKLYDFFIQHIDNLREDVKELLKVKKVLIWGKKQIYGMDCPSINEEDRGQITPLLILAELFDQSLKNSGFVFIVELMPNSYSWYPQICLDYVIVNISRMLNNVHKKPWAKIDKSIYKNMPGVTDFWFYSNPYHTDYMITDFVKYGEKNNVNLDNEQFYDIVEPYDIRSNYFTLDYNYIWRDYGSFNIVTGIIDLALMILYEYHRYYPIWQKKKYFRMATHGLRFASNPYRYVLTELFKKNKSEE